MVVTNIRWDIDMEEVYEILDDMTNEKASKELGISENTYANMTTSERHDFAYDHFRHCPGALDDFMCLPDEVKVPPELSDHEDISDWLSDEYGFCHNGFEVKE